MPVTSTEPFEMIPASAVTVTVFAAQSGASSAEATEAANTAHSSAAGTAKMGRACSVARKNDDEWYNDSEDREIDSRRGEARRSGRGVAYPLARCAGAQRRVRPLGLARHRGAGPSAICVGRRWGAGDGAGRVANGRRLTKRCETRNRRRRRKGNAWPSGTSPLRAAAVPPGGLAHRVPHGLCGP